ncbi:hypothetical protein V6C03_10975 [Methyloligella sp. 2.7D]|uniref:hypothetical protein n=1 Tax=unclassified Methyloligella TaxID=2625955 RepID=UPI00157D3684|nr:hypothetical protein [Methyloligella sp. GL2]QKP77655.1 hypothetical protein HT051_09485 [Methyloligella sp. GL2]
MKPPETTEVPQPENKAKPAAPGLAVAPPNADLSTPTAPTNDAGTTKDVEVFSFGVLPSLDFGLDVLYGQKGEDLKMQPGSDLNSGEDVGVVGKVKRRF